MAYAMPEGERTLQDMKQWNPLIGKVFWQTHPSDPTQGRTIRMHYNVFLDRITPQITNYVTSERPPHLQEIHPRLLTGIHTMQSVNPTPFR